MEKKAQIFERIKRKYKLSERPLPKSYTPSVGNIDSTNRSVTESEGESKNGMKSKSKA